MRVLESFRCQCSPMILILTEQGVLEFSHDEDTFYLFSWPSIARRTSRNGLCPADAAESRQLHQSERIPSAAVGAVARLGGSAEGEHRRQRGGWIGGGIQRPRRNSNIQGTTVGQAAQGKSPTEPD